MSQPSDVRRARAVPVPALPNNDTKKPAAVRSVRPRPIHVFISSRSNDSLEGRALSDIRMALRDDLNGTTLLSKLFLDVRINEDMDAPQQETWWDWSREEVARADLVLVLYNGCSGTPSGTLGICHEEFAIARSLQPNSLYVLRLAPDPRHAPTGAHEERDLAFLAEIGALIHGNLVTSEDELRSRVFGTLEDAIVEKFFAGISATRTRYDRGQALDWRRLSFVERREEMRAAVTETLSDLQKKAGRTVDQERGQWAIYDLEGRAVLFVCDAIPGATGLPAARELVAQPFLRDYAHIKRLDAAERRVGPVHVIACHQSVTEGQARRIVGLPDVTVVPAGFGVHLADEVNGVQILFLADCRDETNTRIRVESALQWLQGVGEARLLVERAASRRAIITAIDAERRRRAPFAELVASPVGARPSRTSAVAGPASRSRSMPRPRTDRSRKRS